METGGKSDTAPGRERKEEGGGEGWVPKGTEQWIEHSQTEKKGGRGNRRDREREGERV